MTAGVWAITGGMPDGVDQTTLTFRAYYKGAVVDQTVFVSKAKSGVQGDPGTGDPAVVISADKPAIQVLCYADGTPVDSSFTGVDGQLTVMVGPSDLTTSCTLSATATGCTGTINTALNTPVAAHAMGYYRITAMSADNATLQLYAVYGGVTYTTTIMIVKAKGGYEIVGTLPVTNLFEGRIVYLTTDGKLYRYHSSAWTTVVPAVDISGTLLDAQIAALAASKITGTLTDSQIAALAASKLTGTVSAATLLTANSIVAGNIAAGAITTATIATGAIVTAKIASNTITAAQIAANTLTANEIAANAITASEIAANTITGNKMAAGNIITASAQINTGVIISAHIGNLQVTTAQIADLTVGTTKITANAITRSANAVGTLTNTASGRLLVLSLAYTPDTTEDIRVDWQALLNNDTFSTTWAPATGLVEICRFQSGVETSLEIYPWNFRGGSQQDLTVFSGIIIDTVGNTVARTYRLYFGTSTGGPTNGVTPTLVVTEFKK